MNKVIGENETGFRGRDDALYRTEGWDFLIAGGALYNNLDYSFTAKHPDGSFLEYQSPGGGSPDLRGQLRILRDFLYEFPFVTMKPDNSVIVSVTPELDARALVAPEKEYAVYVHVLLKDASPEVLQKPLSALLTLNLPRGRYQTHWVNTKTGAIDKSETFDHEGGEKQITSPEFVVDLALRIVRH